MNAIVAVLNWKNGVLKRIVKALNLVVEILNSNVAV